MIDVEYKKERKKGKCSDGSFVMIRKDKENCRREEKLVKIHNNFLSFHQLVKLADFRIVKLFKFINFH